MKILAIDVGKSMGFFDGENPWTKTFEGDRQERAAATLLYLEELAAQPTPFDVWVYERPFARGGPATRALWGLAGIIEAVGQSNGAAVVDIDNNKIRKFVTGLGQKQGKSKQPMMDACLDHFGWANVDEHSADAVCLYHYFLQVHRKA